MSDERWLSEYLLGEGTEQDRATWRRRLDTDPQLQDRVKQLTSVVDQLQQLPGHAWEQFEDSPAPPEPNPLDRPLRPGRPAMRIPRQGIAAVALVAACSIGIAIGAVLSGGRPSGLRMRNAVATLALRPLGGDQSSARGVARVLADGELQLTLNGLPATTRGHYYEAWLMTSNTRLISLASFRVTSRGHTQLTVHLPATPSSYRYIDVSLQDAAAGPTHSDESVLRGSTADG